MPTSELRLFVHSFTNSILSVSVVIDIDVVFPQSLEVAE